MKWVLPILSMLFVFNTGFCAEKAKGEEMAIKDGREVTFDYTLTVDGDIVDSSEGREPFQYTHGEGKIIPGLAEEMEGLHVGDERKITVSPEKAYGPADPNAFKELSRASLPKNIELKKGLPLQVQDANGRTFPVRVAEIKEDSVVLDFNHPLAGKTLNFKVKIVSIK